ncbi:MULTISPECIES: tetratricopeptide repeat protein [unclassified Nodularia (in: cyanobacteria)]|uniref:tetratricopeptide repeat protein n=1 Tax=unclassified Nodularia (in: cyanobacteria) TaxID=2656917 RepID=UPI001882A3A7|nr:MULTISPECIES: tetratricopeptide repeat protein [unclassified Nodularia (in: cyanobacteria)]MBE9201145.1 tetratricopeptide repeat protein [Nodularia sp. LEGE 06071]MCC2695428.1 tetratricopeptide repeat protein [Nodularia sp. LEGE 04288]
MSSSNKLSNQHKNSELLAEIGKFIAYNQDEFAELVTFVDFAEKFTLGFIEINFTPDIDLLIAGLRQNHQCQEIQFVVLDFPDANLRFLRDELVQQLTKIPKKANKKLVLLIRKLEKSIGVFGDYPPVLQDLNFVRDSYRQSVPHPLLFILPDYAISRLAKFAPDFWAWKSGLFRFKTTELTRNRAIANTLNADTNIARLPTPEQQERIDLLHSLLMEYNPTGEIPSLEHLRNCCNILNELGKAYLSQRKPIQAREYLDKAWESTKKFPDYSLQIEVINQLGKSYEQQRQFESANSYHQKALDIAKKLGNRRAVADSLFYLGNVSLHMRQFPQARDYYQQALEIYLEFGASEALPSEARYSCAGIYHNLGYVAQELREYDQARDYYQQALEITIEFGARYECASTYHQLGRVAQELREYDQARNYYQQALEIYLEFGARYNCARIYHQLGMVAQELREYDQARDYYQQALEITIEFGARYECAKTYATLGLLAQAEENYAEAWANLQTALEIYVEYQDEYMATVTREILESLPE